MFYYRDHYIVKEVKTRRINLAITWIDYRNVYDMVPQPWILECLKMYKISDKIIKFINKTMESRIDSGRTDLSRGENSKRHLPG